MVNQKRLVNNFITLVEISSPSGDEAKVAEYISEFLSRLKIQHHSDSTGNVIANLPGDGDPILLTGHMDTVEPGSGIKAVVKNGIISSAGSTILGADNKASLAAILESIEAIVENKLPHRALEIVFTYSEETKNTGVLSLDYSKLKSKYGYAFDLGAPLGTMYLSSPFYFRIDIKITGKASHSSRPDEGINALIVAVRALENIKVGFVNENTICNFGKIYGGTSRNTVPQEITLNAEVRSFVKEDMLKTVSDIKKVFTKYAKEYGAKLEFIGELENVGFAIPEKDPYVLDLIEVYKNLGITPHAEKTYGCFDGNVYINNGIMVITSSDGSKNNHTNEESISVSDIMKLTEVVFQLINFRGL